VGAQFWSVYVPVSMAGPGAPAAVLEQIDVVYRMARRYPETFEMAYGADDVRRIFAAGRIASLVGVEGGHSIHDSLALLRQLYRAGARYMTLTHSANTRWADSSTDAPEHGGLSPFGAEVVREMNRLGMLVDLSHVSAEAMHDALEASEAPVIFSHSSARAVTGHPRNVPDDVLRRLPENGGVVMVTFVQPFVSDESWRHWAERDAEEARLEALHPGDPKGAEVALERWNEEHPAPRATYLDVADHVDHVREVAGIDHVGIGSDFDGIGQGPVGLEGVSDYPVLFAELLRRGWSEADLKKLAGENLLRAFDRVEEVAERLQEERPPSEASIEELDGGDEEQAAGAAAGSSR
jgi:membrane dipeptidase